MNLLPNVHGKSIRVIEFLPREIEVDHLILGFEVTAEGIMPIILGAMPIENYCLYQNAVGEDYDAGPNGRWILPDGTRFSDIVSVRQHFKTTHRDFQDAMTPDPIDLDEEVDGVRKVLPEREASRGIRRGASGGLRRSVYDREVPSGCGQP